MIELEVEHNNFDTFVKRQEFATKLAKAGIDNNWSFCPYTNDGINSDDFIGMRWTLDIGDDIWMQFLLNKHQKITKLVIKVRYETMKDIETKLGEIAKEMIDDSFVIITEIDDNQLKDVNYYGLKFRLRRCDKWIATDFDGLIYSYHNKPSHYEFRFSTYNDHDDGKLLSKVKFKGDWRKSLMEIE